VQLVSAAARVGGQASQLVHLVARVDEWLRPVDSR
jgi:hypothetical protein